MIEPYGLAVYQGNLYLVAAAQEIDDPQERMRHWKLDRFKKVVALDQWFRRDPSVDLVAHLSRSMGIFSSDDPVEVTIRLSSELPFGCLRSHGTLTSGLRRKPMAARSYPCPRLIRAS